MVSLVLFLGSIVLSKLSNELVSVGEGIFNVLSLNLYHGVEAAFIFRITYYMATAEGAHKYIALIWDTLKFFALVKSFPYIAKTIIEISSDLGKSIIPKVGYLDLAQIDKMTAFPGITASILLKIKWFGMLIGSMSAEAAHGFHSIIVMFIYAFAPILIFSSTMFSFTIAFSGLLGFLTVISLWPLSSAIMARIADGVYHITTLADIDAVSVITLFVVYVGVSVVNLCIPFILFRVASGQSPRQAFLSVNRSASEGMNAIGGGLGHLAQAQSYFQRSGNKFQKADPSREASGGGGYPSVIEASPVTRISKEQVYCSSNDIAEKQLTGVKPNYLGYDGPPSPMPSPALPPPPFLFGGETRSSLVSNETWNAATFVQTEPEREKRL